MKKIKMFETTIYGRDNFVKGEVYSVDDSVAYALGTSCEIFETKKIEVKKSPEKSEIKSKSVNKPKSHKMVESAPVNKEMKSEKAEDSSTVKHEEKVTETTANV